MASRLAQTMIWCADGAGAHATRGVGRIVPATVPPAVTGRAAEARREEPPTRVRARVVPPSGKPRTILHRTDLLTPYVAETIAEDALRAGRGAGLDLMVAADASAADVARVRKQFAWLGNRGVRVNVRRDDRPQARRAGETWGQRPAGGGTAGR